MRAEAENAECLSELVRIIWSVIERHSPAVQQAVTKVSVRRFLELTWNEGI